MKSVDEYTFDKAITPDDNSQVIQAISTTRGSFFAIKYYPSSVVKGLDQVTLAQAIVATRRPDHVNIIKCHEVINRLTTDEGLYVVMDWCEGNSLRNTVSQFRRVPENLVARYISQVLQGLEYMHANGMLHNNLKASNILLTNGVVKLTDFGLGAKINNLTIDDHPWYSAPEVLDKGKYSKESDIWALGCTIIELLTGHPPFHDLPPAEAKHKILTELPPIPVNASGHLRDFLAGCFERRPEDRMSASKLRGVFWITTNDPQAKASIGNESKSPMPYRKGLTFVREQPAGIAVPNWADIDAIFDDNDEDDDDIELAKPAPAAPKTPTGIDAFGDSDSDFGDLAPSMSTATIPLVALPGKEARTCPVLEIPGKKMNSESDTDGFEVPVSPLVANTKPPLTPQAGPRSLVTPVVSPEPAAGLLQLKNLGSNSELSSDDFAGSDDGDGYAIFMAEKQHEREEREGSRASVIMESDDDDDFGNIDEVKKPSTENMDIMDRFAEDDSDGDFDVEVDSDHPVNLKLQKFKKKDVDEVNLDFLDEKPNGEEEAIFAQRERIEESRRTILTKIHTLQNGGVSFLLSNLNEILRILDTYPEVRSFLVSQQGILPIIEVMQFGEKKSVVVIEKLLCIVDKLCKDQKDIKENFCLLGGIPPVMEYLSHNYDIKLRQYAVSILTEICLQSSTNTQMFIACNGVSSLIKVLMYDYAAEYGMIATAVQTIVNIIDTRKKTSQQIDFCRIFTKANALEPLSDILFYFAKHTSLETREPTVQTMLDNICSLFDRFSQTDSFVKIEMSKPKVINNIIRTMYNDKDEIEITLTIKNVNSLCIAIRFIGMELEAQEGLTNAGALRMACQLLTKSDADKKQWNVIRFNSMFFIDYMLRLQSTPKRALMVAKMNMLPYLKSLLDGSESEMRSMALSIIMGLPVVQKADKDIMMSMINDNILNIYADNLKESHWCTAAMNAICSIFMDEGLDTDERFQSDDFLEKVRIGIENVNNESAPSFFIVLIKMCDHSNDFVQHLVNKRLLNIIIGRFNITHAKQDNTTLTAQAHLLEFVKSIFKGECVKILRKPELKSIVEKFMTSNNVRQKKAANDILQRFSTCK